jgi:hypothetical protein
MCDFETAKYRQMLNHYGLDGPIRPTTNEQRTKLWSLACAFRDLGKPDDKSDAWKISTHVISTLRDRWQLTKFCVDDLIERYEKAYEQLKAND